ncbi:MAG TPA: response regulator, partial [Sorangium sp.]|nr:response regulator [Sorangium sp.]
GELRCTSALGKGTTFQLLLPATQPGVAARRVATRNQDEKSTHSAPLNILLVEDEVMVRRSARRVLRHAGHVVTEAGDGKEGVDSYLQAAPRPDVVLLDLDMPVMGGEEALTRIRAADPDAVVVLTSGHRDASHETQLVSLGASGFVRKPWTGTELLAAITQAVVRR